MIPIVLKIGGSLAETGRLERVLRIVAKTRRRVVIVPGGGVFADEVRKSQGAEGFADDEAHRQAILAMHRLGRAMIDMQPRFRASDSLEGMQACWLRHGVPVWMPLRMALGDTTIPADWTITSDGLAARLAEHLGHAKLILLKSCRVPRFQTAQVLSRQGVIDEAFPDIARRSGLRFRILGPGEDRELAQLLNVPRHTPSG